MAGTGSLRTLGIAMLFEQPAQLVIGQAEGVCRLALMPPGIGERAIDQLHLEEADGIFKAARRALRPVGRLKLGRA